MSLKIIFIYLVCLSAFAEGFRYRPNDSEDSKFICSTHLSDKSPFDFRFASPDISSSKNNTVQYSAIKKDKKHYRVNQGSVVRLNSDAYGLLNNDVEEYVKVEVVSSAHERLQEKTKDSLKMKRDTASYNNRQAEIGFEGFIHEKDLGENKDLTYLVKEDSILLDIPTLKDLPVVALRPKITEGKYNVEQCCDMEEIKKSQQKDSTLALWMWTQYPRQDLSSYCFDDILFDVVTSSNVSSKPVIEEFNITAFLKDRNEKLDHICIHEWSDIEPLRNVDTDFVLDFIAKIKEDDPEMISDNLIYHYGKDMVQMPFDASSCKVSGSDRGCLGPFGSWYYNPDNANTSGSDEFINPRAGCVFTEVLKYWQKNKCPKDDGCQVQWGDMYHKSTWGDHSTHKSGNCIDIRPMRKDTGGKYGLTKDSLVYDQKKTEDFINVLNRAGASVLYFNDTEISGSSFAPDHDDHIHVCFGKSGLKSETDEEDVIKKQQNQKVCSQGLGKVIADDNRAFMYPSNPTHPNFAP
jgi:penicillin-insensitive murein DD-endopeptidase